MSEFVFRNLSVKLFPAEDEPGLECAPCSRPPTRVCDPCTFGDPCTRTCTRTVTCDRCSGVEFTGAVCLPGTKDPFCGNVSGVNVDLDFEFGRDPADIRAELAVLKSRIRRELAVVEADEQRLNATAVPQSVEELDRLRAQLVAAVEELDQRRAELEGGGPTP